MARRESDSCAGLLLLLLNSFPLPLCLAAKKPRIGSGRSRFSFSPIPPFPLHTAEGVRKFASSPPALPPLLVNVRENGRSLWIPSSSLFSLATFTEDIPHIPPVTANVGVAGAQVRVPLLLPSSFLFLPPRGPAEKERRKFPPVSPPPPTHQHWGQERSFPFLFAFCGRTSVGQFVTGYGVFLFPLPFFLLSR